MIVFHTYPENVHSLAYAVYWFDFTCVWAGCLKVASIASAAQRMKCKKKNLFTFWHSYNTCINVINFNADLGSNFLLKVLVISLQKKPANHVLYAFRRTKTPKWSGEPNDLKVVLGEQNFFSDSLCMRSSLTMVMVEWPTIHMLKHIDTDLVKLFG